MTPAAAAVIRSPLGGRLGWAMYVAWHARHEKALPFWPEERILEVQRGRLRAMVRHAYDQTAFYRSAMDRLGIRPADIRSTEDLARLPIVSKDDFAASPEAFRARNFPDARCLRIDSSGTAGRSKPLHHDAGSLFLSLAHGQRQRAVLRSFTGRLARYREMIAARPGGVHRQMRDFYEGHCWVPRMLELERRDLPVSGITLAEQVAIVNDFRPHVIRGYGSLLGAFFRQVAARGWKLERPRAVVYGADTMPEAEREMIESHFGVPVLSTYQAVEALHIGFQCERRRGFHLFLDDLAVRVVDDEGRDVAPGAPGRLILSNLTNRATVLLNYALGDIVRMDSARCPCGRTLPLLAAVEGRADDMVILPSGEEMHSLVLLEGLRAVAGVVQVQVVQEEPDRFLIRAVPKPLADRFGAEAGLCEALRRSVGGRAAVAVEWRDTIAAEPSGKRKAVICRCRGAVSRGR